MNLKSFFINEVYFNLDFFGQNRERIRKSSISKKGGSGRFYLKEKIRGKTPRGKEKKPLTLPYLQAS